MVLPMRSRQYSGEQLFSRSSPPGFDDNLTALFVIVGTATYYRALIIGIASSQTKDWADRIG